MRTAGREIAQAAQVRMQSAFKVRKAGFVRSMRAKVYAGSPERFPALLVDSRVPWLGLHVKGGTIAGRMLIPLLPEHRRIGRKAFRRVIDGLMRAGNAFFIERNGKVILMAEAIQENTRELSRFKRAERQRTGAKSIKRGQEIPVAVLVRSVSLKRRFDFDGVVKSHMSRLAAAILQQLDRQGL